MTKLVDIETASSKSKRIAGSGNTIIRTIPTTAAARIKSGLLAAFRNRFAATFGVAPPLVAALEVPRGFELAPSNFVSATDRPPDGLQIR
jgi:hypothetical protein